MVKLSITFALAVFLCYSCGYRSIRDVNEKDSPEILLTAPQAGFLSNLASLCGKSFQGKQTYIAPDRESWADKVLIMSVSMCEPNKVFIPFYIDDDRSRTWMFLADEQGLRFRHDHRHEDGSPEDQTLYGGYATGEGTAFSQFFPADEYTNQLLNNGRQRQWNIMLAEDMSSFTYQLLYEGELIFEAKFDLTTAI